MRPRVISLCDYTGNWARPWADAGWDVELVDLKYGKDARVYKYQTGGGVDVVLAAFDCNCFAGSGAQYWPAKDADGRTLAALALMDACCRIVLVHRPRVWAMEQPVGRTRLWLGPPRMYFNPCDYGDPYTKRTCLWGEFNIPVKAPVEPERVCSQGSWLMRLGGKSERTKELRSATPPGFARAFFEANKDGRCAG